MTRFNNHPRKRFTPDRWFQAWQQRTQPPTAEQLVRRNELKLFRLILGTKEPQQ